MKIAIFEKGDTFSKPKILVSMLDFWGVYTTGWWNPTATPGSHLLRKAWHRIWDDFHRGFQMSTDSTDLLFGSNGDMFYHWSLQVVCRVPHVQAHELLVVMLSWRYIQIVSVTNEVWGIVYLVYQFKFFPGATSETVKHQNKTNRRPILRPWHL